MYEPDKMPVFNPDKSTLQWFIESYFKLNASEKPYECICNVGDIIYFPDRFYHATLTVDNAVFISTFLSSINFF